MRPLLLTVLLVLIVLAVSGPRIGTEHRVSEPELPEDLDAYLRSSEARVPDLKPGTEKTIVWAQADRRRTPISLIYLHGFSATRREVAPLADQVAAALGANLYYTRLTGHGRGPEAMTEASLQAWLDDAREALAIGRRIGEEVVVMGTSTGGTLAIWLAMHPGSGPPLATVLISPNLGPRPWQSSLLTWPWAELFVPLVQGQTYAFTPYNPDHERYWTIEFPVEALFPMAATVELVSQADPTALRSPTLIFYSPADRIVYGHRIEEFYEALEVSPRALVAVEDSADPQQHVLAGDILSPGTTERLARRIVSFVQAARIERGRGPPSSRTDGANRHIGPEPPDRYTIDAHREGTRILPSTPPPDTRELPRAARRPAADPDAGPGG